MMRDLAGEHPGRLPALSTLAAIVAMLTTLLMPAPEAAARAQCLSGNALVCDASPTGRQMASGDTANVDMANRMSATGANAVLRMAAANACPPEICKERYRPPVAVDACGRPVVGGSRRVYSLGCGPTPVKRACPRVHAPVCGRIGRVERTYANDCEAERAGARLIRRGECRVIAPPPPPRFMLPRICPQIYAPVCGRDRTGRLRTYPNDCMALGDRAGVVHRGECRQGQ